MSVISLANRTLTTPALQDLAEHFSDEIPEEVRRYISEIFTRNLARNDRLTEQLTEALAALDAHRITPTLLKGSAMLATLSRAKMGRRLVTDLDLMVSPDEAGAALDCLQHLGYRIHAKTADGGPKWYADLARPDAVGMIDLHQHPPGHRFFYSAAGDVRHHCRLQGAAYIPSATYQALMLIIHDQFQDSDYWVGKIDRRHLLDLRDIANSPDGIDWNLLASLAPGKLARNAIETQLITLNLLLGVSVPDQMRRRMIPRLQYWRRRLQAHLPGLYHAMFFLVLFDYGKYRAEVGLAERSAHQPAPGRWRLPKINTARFLLARAREQHAGKV
jgi:hypothetical protein